MKTPPAGGPGSPHRPTLPKHPTSFASTLEEALEAAGVQCAKPEKPKPGKPTPQPFEDSPPPLPPPTPPPPQVPGPLE